MDCECFGSKRKIDPNVSFCGGILSNNLLSDGSEMTQERHYAIEILQLNVTTYIYTTANKLSFSEFSMRF